MDGHRIVDDDLAEDDLRHIAEHGNPDEAHIAVKPDEGKDVVWLEKGNKGNGWEHIEKRHVDGTYKIDNKGATTLFPVGQTVKGKQLPKTMSRNDVKEMINDAVKYGEPDARGTMYRFEPTKNGYPDSGVQTMKVEVDASGKIMTAHPVKVTDEVKYVPGLGEFISDPL